MRKKGDTVDAYVTENPSTASKLVSKDITPMNIKEISFDDLRAYFMIEAPEKGVTFSAQGTFKDAFKVSDNSALSDYLREVARIASLGAYNKERDEWENKRKENLAALVAKESK